QFHGQSRKGPQKALVALDMHVSEVVTREKWIVLLSSAGILAHLCLRFLVHLGAGISNIPLFLAIALGGAPLLWGLSRRLWNRDFGSDLLAGLSILTAVLTGQHLVATIIILMLSGGRALESYATERAKSVLSALAKRTPTVAHR